MIRNVDLVSYLPPIMAEFQEYRATLEAENPEFVLVWNATDQVLQNEFIATADEYGISRFEQILNILPSKEDTLESRRSRVQTRWFNTIPYTLKTLLGKLIALCGENNFTVVKDYDHYKISIFTDLELFGQAEELDFTLDTMIPCNMIVVSRNNIPCNASGFALICGGVCFVQNFFITNDFQENHSITGDTKVGGGIVDAAFQFITNDSEENHVVNGGAGFGGAPISTEHLFITNDSTEHSTVDGAAIHGGGLVSNVSVTITNDFNEKFNVNGDALNGAGVVFTEFNEMN